MELLARIDRTSKGIIWGKICVLKSNVSGTKHQTNIKATALKSFLGSKLITFSVFVIDTLLGLGYKFLSTINDTVQDF